MAPPPPSGDEQSSTSHTPQQFKDEHSEPAHTSPRKRRALRAAQACDLCREKKRACDEGHPCGNCVKEGSNCQYSSSKSTRFRENVSEIEAAFKHLESYTARLNSHMERLESWTNDLRGPVYAVDRSRAPDTQAHPRSRRDALSLAGCHHLMRLWPTIHNLLYEAHNPTDPDYVLDSEMKSFPNHEPSAKLEANHFISTSPRHTNVHSYRNGHLYVNGVDQPEYSGLPHQLYDSRSMRLKRLLSSYVENIHALHPILDLDDTFLSDFEPLFDGPPDSATDATPTDRPSKRQRIGSVDFGHDDVMNGDGRSASKTQVPLDRARLYLILALGEICASKADSAYTSSGLSPVDSSVGTNSSFHSFTASARSGSMSPRTLRGTESFGSPVTRKIPQQWGDRGSKCGKCAPPGMQYYERATRIIGNHMDGNDLIHAQTAILAGLYKGQIGRVRESMNWICIAGRIIQYLLHQYNLVNSDNMHHMNSSGSKKKPKGPMDDLVRLNALSCIQLESDILAQLPFPTSGILGFEGRISWPTQIPLGYLRFLSEDKRSELSMFNVLVSFTSQLWLRRELNRMEDQLHGSEITLFSEVDMRTALELQQTQLDSWRNTLPAIFAWKDEEEPASCILAARIRAKYWGACFLTHRPYLDYALHASKEREDMQPVALDAQGHVRSDAASRLFEAIDKMPEAAKVGGVRRCVEAAFQSTRAFDSIPHELIVTNLHGTAHAQFGNVLVLAAAYFANLPSISITQDALVSLITRTLRFLDRQSFLPQTCKIDYGILQSLLNLVAHAA